MNDEYKLYLDGYVFASIAEHPGKAAYVHMNDLIRPRVILAIAAHDASTGRGPRTPAELADEADRIFPAEAAPSTTG